MAFPLAKPFALCRHGTQTVEPLVKEACGYRQRIPGTGSTTRKAHHAIRPDAGGAAESSMQRTRAASHGRARRRPRQNHGDRLRKQRPRPSDRRRTRPAIPSPAACFCSIPCIHEDLETRVQQAIDRMRSRLRKLSCSVDLAGIAKAPYKYASPQRVIVADPLPRTSAPS